MFGFIKNYINKRINLLKLELTENVSFLISILLTTILILFFSLLFILLFSIGISILIGTQLGNIGFGFLILSLFYLILFIIFISSYPKISKFIMKKIIEHQINKNQNESINDEE